ncbi:hypothetical protein K1719_012290 [Acacia pycnantha]|nr:hypothetical protein K1719_012290 [Acacia pycnantha]
MNHAAQHSASPKCSRRDQQDHAFSRTRKHRRIRGSERSAVETLSVIGSSVGCGVKPAGIHYRRRSRAFVITVVPTVACQILEETEV